LFWADIVADVMGVENSMFVCGSEAVFDVKVAMLDPLVQLASYWVLYNGFGWLPGHKGS